jgi:hypothetical protein
MSISRLTLFVMALLVVSPGMAASLGSNPAVIHFKMVGGVGIVVPVKVNGAGPFEFLLDTGTTTTIIDAKLAAQLKLPVTGKTIEHTSKESLVLLKVLANRLEVAGTAVNDFKLPVFPDSVIPRYPGVRGILGEDFLSRFDLLLDNRHHLLRMEQAPGSMGEMLLGEHVPLSSHGSFQGQATLSRLMLRVQVPELKIEALTVLLDSGASAPVLFRSAYREPLVSVPSRGPVDQLLVKMLRVGNLNLPNVLMMTPPQWQPADSDGLLPTSIFQSVYISHSGGFAIFNPVIK